MKRVSEIEGEPTVGRFYLVPCVQDRHGKWSPVIGPLHHDKEYIGVSQEHYHYDLRFVSDEQIKDRCEFFCATQPVTVSQEEYMMIALLLTEHEPTEKRLQCKRQMPKFPLRVVRAIAPWMEPMEKAFKDTTLNCARCPHRGGPLAAELADSEGNVICPLHGLQWNLNTGKLVSRL